VVVTVVVGAAVGAAVAVMIPFVAFHRMMQAVHEQWSG